MYNKIINKIKSKDIREYVLKNNFDTAIKEYIKFNNKVELIYSNRSNRIGKIFNVNNNLILNIADNKEEININMLDIKEIVFTKRRLEILIK